MEELKTLKDLKEYINVKNVGGEFQHGWNNALDEARLQAIKWIKLWNTDKRISARKRIRDQIQEKIEAFKDFFNITDEDLK